MIFLRRALVALTLLVLFTGGFLLSALSADRYQREIELGTNVIDAATTDKARAEGYLQRGRAYAELVRYRHVMRSIQAGDYVRLYQSAVRDLDAALQLDPGNVDALNARGLTYFERSWTASENRFETADAVATWLARAKGDFNAIIDQDARNELALDYRGMINEKQGDYIAAIDDFTRVSALNARLGTIRLADLYCRRGGVWLGKKQYHKAVTDLEQSIALVADGDACECDPYGPLLWTYFEGFADFDKSWALVHRAQGNKRWLMPEVVEKLKVASSRDR